MIETVVVEVKKEVVVEAELVIVIVVGAEVVDMKGVAEVIDMSVHVVGIVNVVIVAEAEAAREIMRWIR